ncbi:hypothetical protein ANANG_G00040400 [Anguilla anguilla]|uniref:Uncharacterized protein n=1 Tax=Anguilla anguilla TaxID=7936 RepID=A0A9D3S9A4_ANGAN|nr:hypothetical protein ANANG_G00040400 [Anguilla anguilla]
MSCAERSSLQTAMKHIAVLVLISFAALLLHFLTFQTINFRKCSSNTVAVIFLSFFGPGLAFLALAVGLQKRRIFCNLPSTLLRGPGQTFFWKSIFLSVYPSLYWVAMLMIDGQYYRSYSMCKEPDRRDYFDFQHDKAEEFHVKSQMIGLILILLLASLVLLYFIIERCCRPVAWRLEEQRALALQKEQDECVARFALALAKRTVAQQEHHLYETPLQQQPNIAGPAIPASVPRSLTGYDVVHIINHPPVNTLYG